MIAQTYISSGKIFSNDKRLFELFNRERFGEKEGDKIILSPYESLYLLESRKIRILDLREKPLDEKDFIRRFERKDKKFSTKYAVFKNLRKRGDIVKSALKFGAEFRVYEKGSKIGEEHAKWILFCISEHDKISVQEFSSRNRIAHSTNKKLLIGVVDDEGDVSYYESGWVKK